MDRFDDAAWSMVIVWTSSGVAIGTLPTATPSGIRLARAAGTRSVPDQIAASIIPIDDANVLRRNGSKVSAYRVPGTTAAIMLATAALLLCGPE